MKNVFDFDTQLLVGNTGEKIFQQFYNNLMPQKSSDRAFDFILNDGTTVELKTDTYPMDGTPNFFIELYSDSDKGSLGGPWRALSDKANHFVYFFINNKTFFWFEPISLCEAIETIITNHHLELKTIYNKGWKTQGYLIPREMLQSVEKRRDTILTPAEADNQSNVPF